MSIEALILMAMDKGIALSLVHGRLKYAGRREAVNELFDPLRRHKSELIRWFHAANDRLNVQENSEEAGVLLGPDKLNAQPPAGTSVATKSGQSDPRPLFRQRGPWLTDRESIAAKEYHAQHFNCPTCIAAGRGSRYGQRCGAGMALWMDYQDAPRL